MSVTSKRPVRLWVAGAVIAVVLGFLVVQGLGNATLYFRTVDEASAQRDELGTRRFRIQGDVVPGSVRSTDDGVTFVLSGSRSTLEVTHQGDPPELFRPEIPVVLEGRFEGTRFLSDRMLVKHDETYIAENPDRVEPYGEGPGAQDSPAP